MTYCPESSASKQEDFSTQILGETGGTVVYVFANGNARVKKGKKVILETDLASASSGDRPDSSTSKIHYKTESHRPPSTSGINPTSLPFKSKPTKQRMVPHSSGSCEPLHPKPLSPTVMPTTATFPRVSPVPEASLVDYLLAKKLISSVQLEVAQYDANSSGLSVGDVLLARGWVTQEALTQFSKAITS